MRRRMPIFYSALLLTGVNLLLRMVSTGFQVFLSGRIGAAGIGLLQLVLSVGAMAMTAGIGGIRTATMYLTAEELGKKRPGHVVWVLSGAVLYSILFSSAVGATLYLSAPWLAKNWIGHPEAMDSLRLYAGFLPVCCLTGVMTGYFTAANRIGTLAAVEVAEQFCAMAATVALLTFWAENDPQKSCEAVILGSSIGACLTLLCLAFLRCRENPRSSPRIPIRKRLTSAAVPLALADDLKAGISTAENLMVPKRLALYPGTANPLALFGTVCGMVFPVLMFPAAILFGLTELLIPELARCNAAGNSYRIRHLVRRSLHIALLYGTLCSGILWLCSDNLCLRLYNSVDAGHYLRRFSIMAVMLYCDIITDAMVKGLGQQKISVRYNILTSSMDVALLYILLPKYGIEGYYFSFLVTHVINFVLSLSRLTKITKIRIPIRIPVLTLVSAIGSAWAASYVPNSLMRATAFSAILFSALLLLRIIKKSDFLWFASLIRKK